MLFPVVLLVSSIGFSSSLVFPRSEVVTSAEILPGKTFNFSASRQTDGAYKVLAYGVYQHGKGDDGDEYAKNVIISDATGLDINLYKLSQVSNSDYFLSSIELNGPISVIDNNVSPVPGGYPNKPAFTIYSVERSILSYQVMSASKALGNRVGTQKAWLSSGVTILNAEPFIRLSNFDIGNAALLNIATAGYDMSGKKDYNVLFVGSKDYAQSSFLDIPAGPIVTVYTTKVSTNVKFSFLINDALNYNSTVQPGAAFAVMSHSWASPSDSYISPHVVPAAYNVHYNFDGRSAPTNIDFYTGVFDDGQMAVANIDAMNQARMYNLTANNEFSERNVVMYQFSLTVTGGLNDRPKYLIRVASGTTSIGIFFAFLAVLFSKLFL